MPCAGVVLPQALDYAESNGYTVIPSCSYVERYMERHQRRAAKL
jgi:predicted GNAT family acetyltransferase